MAADTDAQQDVQRAPNGGLRPVPDPSVLTTEALTREVGALKELLVLRVEASEEACAKDLRGFERTIDERFTAVLERLNLTETQRVEQKADTKAAVDAALTAQKEAVKEQTTASERAIAKSEAATTKSIEQMGTTFTTAFDGVRRDIDDLKERVGGAEGAKLGRGEQREVSSTSQSTVIAYVVAAAAVVAAVVAVLTSGGTP